MHWYRKVLWPSSPPTPGAWLAAGDAAACATPTQPRIALMPQSSPLQGKAVAKLGRGWQQAILEHCGVCPHSLLSIRASQHPFSSQQQQQLQQLGVDSPSLLATGVSPEVPPISDAAAARHLACPPACSLPPAAFVDGWVAKIEDQPDTRRAQ
eukprot:1153129-Pelagomonas_calceolata.AAC.3